MTGIVVHRYLNGSREEVGRERLVTEILWVSRHEQTNGMRGVRVWWVDGCWVDIHGATCWLRVWITERERYMLSRAGPGSDSIARPIGHLQYPISLYRSDTGDYCSRPDSLNQPGMAPIALSPPASPSTTTGTTSTTSRKSATQPHSSPPLLNQYRGYDHIHWYVGNARQAASYYITRLGFTLLAYRGLETGSRVLASHVVGNGDVTFVLTSPLRGLDRADRFTGGERELLREIHDHLERHGDGVKDVAFEVDDVDALFDAAVGNGAVSVAEPRVLRDKDGEAKLATIKTYGDTTHTLVERGRYKGAFLPGYRSEIGKMDPLATFLPVVELEAVDHCVGNQDWDEMDEVCE